MHRAPSVEQWLAQAQRAQQGGRNDEALALYARVLKSDSLNFAALANLGVAAARAGDIEGGRALLERAVAVVPGSAEAWIGLGNACAQADDFKRATEAFAQAARLRPDLAAAHVNLGNALRRQSRLVEALAALRRGVSLDDSLAAGHFNLGLALQESGDVDAAIAAFSGAIARDPRYGAARSALGLAQLHAGRASDALGTFNTLIAHAPNFPSAIYNRGVALQTMGHDDDAIADFHATLAIEPGRLDALNNLILSLIRTDRSAEALEACAAYQAVAPAHPRALAYEAVALLELDRREEAARLLDFEHLLHACTISVPAGFDSLDTFNAALAIQVANDDTLIYEPADKSTHGGSQSGEFADHKAGAAAALRETIVDVVRRYMVELREKMPTHPFVAALPGKWRLATWAVSLQSQGYQGPHFHPDGRVSGVYYAAIPPEVANARDGAGALEFGQTSDAIGGSATPLLHRISPREGTMVVFPSYFYHRTLPFESAAPRISIAFDVMPDH